MKANKRKLPQRVYQKHGAYYFVHADGKWERLGKEFTEAMVAYAEVMNRATPGRPQSRTVSDLLARYLKEVAPTKAPRTHKDNLAEAQNLNEALGHMEIASVRPIHVAQFLEARGREASVRANRERALLSHAFTKAMVWGWADFNPCRGVPRITERPRDRYVQDNEVLAVEQSASTPVVRWVSEVAYMTGQRISDVLGIRLSDLSDEGIMFVQGKTGNRLVIAWTGDLRAMVDEVLRHPKRRGSQYLFTPERGREERYTYHGFSAIFKRARAKALKDGTLKSSFRFHDLRGKAATDAKRSGRTDAQQLLGHSTSAQTEAYIKQREVEVVQPMNGIRRK